MTRERARFGSRRPHGSSWLQVSPAGSGSATVAVPEAAVPTLDALTVNVRLLARGEHRRVHDVDAVVGELKVTVGNPPVVPYL